MKIKSLVVAASLAMVPATAALAVDKEAIKKAKEEAKQKAIEAAKAKVEAKQEVVEKKSEAKQAKKASDKKADEEARAAAAEENVKTNARHTGLIERLEQVATATGNAELTAVVARLREKEAKRFALANPDA
jgi:hypothetical protein